MLKQAAELVENVIAALSTLCRTCEMCCTSQATLHSVDRIDVWLLFQLLSLLLTKVPEVFMHVFLSLLQYHAEYIYIHICFVSLYKL